MLIVCKIDVMQTSKTVYQASRDGVPGPEIFYHRLDVIVLIIFLSAFVTATCATIATGD
jgi:hypothetical protein